MTPTEVDHSLRERGVTLQAIRRTVDPACFVISPRRAWLGVARAFLTLALGELLLWSIPTGGPLWTRGTSMACGWVLVWLGLLGCFVIGHDCGHLSFSRRLWVNYLVGHVCMSVGMNGFHNWRLAHNHHHAHPQLRGVDTDWAERMPTRAEHEAASPRVQLEQRLTYGSVLGVVLGFPVSMVRRTWIGALYPQIALTRQARRQVLGSNLVLLAISGGIVVGLWRAAGLWGVLEYYGVPIFMGMLSGALLTLLHHSSDDALAYDEAGWTPVRGQVVGTFDVRFPVVVEFLLYQINRHLPHHLAPRIPWYHLPRATRSLQAAWPELRQERRFSLRYLARIWSAPLLEPVGDGVYHAAQMRSPSADSTPVPGA